MKVKLEEAHLHRGGITPYGVNYSLQRALVLKQFQITVSAIHVIYYYYCCFSLMQLLYSGVYAKQDLILISLVLFVDYSLSKVTYQLGRKFFSENLAGFVAKITGMKA